MSPNVGNFVHDLVEMAKAMETLPQVQAELDRANTQIESYAKQVQDREIAIINYKQEIDDLHAKVRSLEVERDDASFRVLEAEDQAASVLSKAQAARANLDVIISKLDPPKPEPMKEPEPRPQVEDTPVPDAVHSISETGQSESSPTVETASGQSPVADQGSAFAPEPTHGPYYGKRYDDQPAYIPLSQWLSGGGTEADYFWRPEKVNF